MTSFSIAVGVPPQTPLGELTAGGGAKGWGARGREWVEREWSGREGKVCFIGFVSDGVCPFVRSDGV